MTAAVRGPRRAPPEELRPRRREWIRRLIAQRALDPVFQPILRLHDERLVGFEALARVHGDRTRPAELFAEAARVGLGLDLELLAVERAFEHLDEVPAGCWLSVNLSPDTLLTPPARDLLLAERPRQVVVELTEHVAVEDYPSLLVRVAELREHGVLVAVDDAGAGHSSLRHILRLRPDLIKLDIEITRDVHRDPVRQTLASSLLRFARSVGAELVAEGVEQQAELDMLARIGIDCVQGFLLGKPGPLPGPVSFPRVGDNARPQDLGAILGRVAAAVTVATDAETLVRPLLDVVLETTGMQTAYVTFFDGEERTLEHRYVRNTGPIRLPEGLTLPWLDTLCYRCRQKDLVWTADVPRELPGVRLAEDAGVRSFLSLPITGRDGELLGTLCAGSTEHLFVGEETLLHLRMLARIVGHYGMEPAPPG